MKTHFYVGIKDLAQLLVIRHEQDPDSWRITHWILDVLGFPPEWLGDWNTLTPAQRREGVDSRGLLLMCRDQLNAMADLEAGQRLGQAQAEAIICAWIDALRVQEQPQAANDGRTDS